MFANLLKRALKPAPRKHRPSTQTSRRFRPALEALEDRQLLSTVIYVAPSDRDIGSLQSAIDSASPGSIIQLRSGTGEITLSGTLHINKDLTIEGPGAQNLTLSGNHAVEVFEIGTTANAHVTVTGLTIAHGQASYGGGIFVGGAGDLTLRDCVVAHNHATVFGGGIESAGHLKLESSTVWDNSAGVSGGGILNDPAAHHGGLELFNSTVANNTARQYGGGIMSGSTPGVFPETVTIRNSTIAGNSATHGGGIAAGENSTYQLINTIVAGSTDSSQGTPIQDIWGSGTVVSLGSNLIQSIRPPTGEPPITITGVGVRLDNPLLGPLQDNGGPTPTMAIGPNSPAYRQGAVSWFEGANLVNATQDDQRHLLRPVTRTGDLVVDIGAYTYAQATRFSVELPPDRFFFLREGDPFPLVVRALGDDGNIVRSYSGTVEITTSAGDAPIRETFAATDRGVHEFSSVTVSGSGQQRLTATDVINGSIRGTFDLNLFPSPDPLIGLVFSGEPPVWVG